MVQLSDKIFARYNGQQYSTYILGILKTDEKKIEESLQFPHFLIKYVKKKGVFKKIGNIQVGLLP